MILSETPEGSALRRAEAAAEAARLEPDPVRDLAEKNERSLVGVRRELARTNETVSQVQGTENPLQSQVDGTLQTKALPNEPVLPVQLAREVNVIRSQTDRAHTAGSDRINHLHIRVGELEAQARTTRETAERAARAREATAARARAAREAAAARQAEAVAVAAELAEMQARRELEESDHTLAERTAAAEQDLAGPWDPAAVSGSDSGKPTGFPRFSGDKAKGSIHSLRCLTCGFS